MKVILFIVAFFSVLSLHGKGKEYNPDTMNSLISIENIENDSIQDTTIYEKTSKNNFFIYNEKINIGEKPATDMQSGEASALLILSAILIIICSIFMFIRLWTYKNANRIEEGKYKYNFPELFSECVFSFDYLWLFPIQNNYKNEQAKQMDRISTITLYSMYICLVAFIVICLSL